MTRAPPDRKSRFVHYMLMYANDDSHGYSQKPPSGRWGPDYDCSSLIYQAAHDAGYPVGTGRDRVRFTGTMLKDFEKAGFQILPFANVGISDLKIGDILLNLALHAEVYVGNGESVGATGSETGGFVGEAGDQTGKEIERHSVTTFDKEWDYILRPPNDKEKKEGDEEVPYYGSNYGAWPSNGQTMYPQSTAPIGRSYSTGYPQGNLGQMNGYSQANAGYPQGMTNDLPFVMGIEGAKNFHGTPNGRMALFDEDKPLMYVVGFDQQGNCNDIHVYEFTECSEEMPQHLSPLMRGSQMSMGGGLGQMADYVTREEFEQLKEMLHGQSATSSNEPAASGSTTQSATAGRTR